MPDILNEQTVRKAPFSKSRSENMDYVKSIVRRLRVVPSKGFLLSHLLLGLLNSGVISTTFAAPSNAPDYLAVDAIFNQHCLDCHASQDPEHGLVLDSFEALSKGGESGPAIIPGKSQDSLLVQMIEGRFEKEGKNKTMPPGKRKKLTPDEIATIRSWVDSGAKGPSKPALAKDLVVPKIIPKSRPRDPVFALAISSDGNTVAAARYSQVELRSGKNLNLLRTLEGPNGNVNAVAFSWDSSQIFAAGGQPALAGKVRQWTVADGKLLRSFEGHKDAIYALALSPDGKTLATGSYDQKIKLWSLATGQEIKNLSGHNGCVYQLAFRPDGKILASASADRTVKLWNVASGERRETFSQSLKEVRTLAFSPDGKRLYAGGADSRIRVWEISETAAETTNPLLQSKFAHEGAILSLVFSRDGKTLISSAEDRTVKVWEPVQMKQLLMFELQPDWPPGLAFDDSGKVFVGRLDGSITQYDLISGKALANAATSAGTIASKPSSERAANALPAGRRNVNK
jgi:WD40 repeat protein